MKDRIDNGAIRLSEKELKYYTGAGLRLARVVDGEAIEMLDPLDIVEMSADASADATAALSACLEWARKGGEIWCGFASCLSLCDPWQLDTLDARHLARLGRMIGDSIAEI